VSFWNADTASGIDQGGSLAGKVSIRLSAISSAIASASLSTCRKGRPAVRSLRPSCCTVLGDIGGRRPWSGGCADRRAIDPLVLPRTKFEGEYDERDAEGECICAYPPCQHDSANQRRGDEQRAISNGQQPAQDHPPPAVGRMPAVVPAMGSVRPASPPPGVTFAACPAHAFADR